MELNYFKDKLFDLLNDSEEIEIMDLTAEDRNNLLTVRTEDGSVFELVCREATKFSVQALHMFPFELVCREATDKEGGWKNAN